MDNPEAKDIPPSKQRKTSRKSPHAVVNAQKAREARALQMQERRKQLLEKYGYKDDNDVDDDNISSSDDEIILIPRGRKKKEVEKLLQKEDPTKNLRKELDDLKLSIKVSNEQKIEKQKEKAEKKKQLDQEKKQKEQEEFEKQKKQPIQQSPYINNSMAEHLRFKILDF